MPVQLKEKDDIKIFILHILMNIDEPVDFVTLNDIVMQDEYVNGFDFCDCFYELVDAQNIAALPEDEKKFVITRQGKVVAKALESELLLSIRSRSARSAIKYMLALKKESFSKSDIREENGMFLLDIEMAKGTKVYLKCTLYFDSRVQAEKMQLGFDERSHLLYPGILGLLSGDVDYLA